MDRSIRPRGLILDIDGTLVDDGRVVAGAPEAIAALRAAGVPLRFVTNTTRVGRPAIVDQLGRLGIHTAGDELFTAPLAAAAWLAREGLRRIALCLPPEAAEAFADLDIVDECPDAVVVGDLGDGWTFARLNQAFRWILDGARLVALQRNRYWRTGGGVQLDAGPYVAALEYAAGVTATLVGKPSRPMFEMAAASMGLGLDAVAVVGDDIASDVGGGQAAGAMGILVKTGKFRAAELERSSVHPDLILDSVADLPRALFDRPSSS